MIEVLESALQKAAGEGMDEFIQAFTDKYKEIIGGELTAETMPLLTGEQHSLLAYQIFRDEIMVGGFCQLIQNGYGGYIFDNPFAKVDGGLEQMTAVHTDFETILPHLITKYVPVGLAGLWNSCV